jgi:hypothetical protein
MSNIGSALLLVGAIAIIALMAISAIMPVLQASVAQADPQLPEIDLALAAGGTGIIEVTGNHAWLAHDAEAIQALSCLENKGPQVTFREPRKGPVHFLCMADNGTWYDVIVEVAEKGKMKLKSAFSPKDGTSARIYKWLNNKGATQWKSGPSTIKFDWGGFPKPW